MQDPKFNLHKEKISYYIFTKQEFSRHLATSNELTLLFPSAFPTLDNHCLFSLKPSPFHSKRPTARKTLVVCFVSHVYYTSGEEK